MDINSFGPCGLICGLCKKNHGECTGCRFGGGDRKCYQLTCCKDKGIAGCWECENFPCNKGYFADEKRKGLITGFARCVKENGAERFYNIVKTKFGNSINYEDFLSISEQNIINMLQNRIK